ncbi:MAG TPA: hypothetical protein VHL53_02625 [Acidimicrobiia bacterium]|nr:hypothetical protein [Acidimicrobiia bacterium]
MSVSPPSRLRRGLIALLALVMAGLAPILTSGAAVSASAAPSPAKGYWMVASDGGIFAYGGARFFGSTGAIKLNMPIVGMAATPSGNGYWLVASDGGIFSFGDAAFYGSTGGLKLNKPIVGMASTPTGRGYWLVASDGGIFAFGDAGFFGSTGSIKLNKPITGMTPSGTGHGYRMVATDGGIFSFGDATFYGSAGGTNLAKPIAGMAPTPSGAGYWLVGTDGQVFSYGDAAVLGSAPALRQVVAVAPSPTGAGYWAVAANGGLAAFGDAPDLGHPTGALARPIVGMAVYSPPAGAAIDPGTGAVIDPGPGSTETTVTTMPEVVGALSYASEPLAGTYGTGPATKVDPSHPFRTVCGNAPKPQPGQPSRQNPCNSDNNPNFANEVRAIVEVGDRVFVGGFFPDGWDTGMKPETPSNPLMRYLAELDAKTGRPIPNSYFTKNAVITPDGNCSPSLDPSSSSACTIEAMAVSPDGKRLYIGGRVTNVNGHSVRRLAALKLDEGQPDDGTLDTTFTINGGPSASVHSLDAVGDRVYVGGSFTHWGINGATCSDTGGATANCPLYPGIVALDLSGNLITSFNPPPYDNGSYAGRRGIASVTPGVIYSIKATPDGQTLILGGDFINFSESPSCGNPGEPACNHGGIIAISARDGSLSTWRPINARPVFQLALSPDGMKVYGAAGGGGGAVLAFTVGKDTRDWQGNDDGDTLSVAATGSVVYAGGHFDAVYGGPYDPNDPDLKGIPCLHPSDGGPTICVGEKDWVNNRHIGAWDAATGAPLTGPDGFHGQADTAEGPSFMLAGNNGLYVGGNFFDIATTSTIRKKSNGTWSVALTNPTYHPGFAIFPPAK